MKRSSDINSASDLSKRLSEVENENLKLRAEIMSLKNKQSVDRELEKFSECLFKKGGSISIEELRDMPLGKFVSIILSSSLELRVMEVEAVILNREEINE